MLEELSQNKQNVIVIGDVFVSCETMADAIRKSSIRVGELMRYSGEKIRSNLFQRNRLISRRTDRMQSHIQKNWIH